MQKLIKISIIILSLFFSAKINAQNYKDFQYIDSLTYQLYLQQDWKELGKISRLAFKNDIDYYYLRMRAGIADFERSKYLVAEKHFKKAASFNDLDSDPKEYLLYSMLYSGKKDDAKHLYYKSEKLPEIQPLKLKALSEISVNSAYFFNLDNAPENAVKTTEVTNTDGYQVVTKNYLLNSALIKHDINPSFYLSQGISVILKNQYYLYSSTGNINESLENTTKQYQYYLSAKYIPVTDVSIIGSFHYINYQAPSFNLYDRPSRNRSVMPEFRQNYLAGDISIYKSFRLFKGGIGFTKANLNDAQQLQKNFTLAFFPLGNLNLYLTSIVNHVKETKINTSVDNNVLFRQALGFKVFKNMWIESTAYVGTVKNAVLNEGYIVFNTNEPVHSRYDVNLVFPFKSLTFNLLLSYNSFSSSFNPFNGVNIDYNVMDFNGLLSLISFKWNL